MCVFCRRFGEVETQVIARRRNACAPHARVAFWATSSDTGDGSDNQWARRHEIHHPTDRLRTECSRGHRPCEEILMATRRVGVPTKPRRPSAGQLPEGHRPAHVRGPVAGELSLRLLPHSGVSIWQPDVIVCHPCPWIDKRDLGDESFTRGRVADHRECPAWRVKLHDPARAG